MMRLRHLLLLLPFLFAVNARAELWDITITGPAVYSGIEGAQTVVYRYDPADITLVQCEYGEICPYDENDPFRGVGSDFPHDFTYGPIQSVRWHGLVSGSGGPALLRTSMDWYNPAAQPANFGGTVFGVGPFLDSACGVIGIYACPSDASIEIPTIQWDSYPVLGGEDGWIWKTNIGGPDGIVGRITLSRAVPEPGTLALLAAALGVVAIRGKRQHGIS